MKHLCKKIAAVVSAVCVLFCTFSAYAVADERLQSTLGASASCAGHTLGTFSGVPACVNDNGDLHICENNFPDKIFRECIVADKQGAEDRYFTEDECASIDSYSFGQHGIQSLRGIEFFTALERLRCVDNQLTELDVSNNTALVSLECFYNQLTELDMSNNTALEDLACFYNQLTELNVSNNTALKRLDCGDNQLTELDVSNNSALVTFFCHNNQLTELDVSNNTVLEWLFCSENQLTELDVSNITALMELACDSNQLTVLDISKNVNLCCLVCSRNRLTKLDIPPSSLQELHCSDNCLTRLDVTNCPYLEKLDCSNNNMTELFTNKWDGKWTLLEVSPQTSTLPLVKNGDVWTADLRSLVANEDDVSRIDIDSISEGTYDWRTGLLTFTEKPTSFTYECYIGKVQKQMEVTVHLTESESTCKATINGIEYQYAVGEQVSIAADAFYANKGYGYRFDKWEGNADIADTGANATTFTMPAQDVTIHSSYYLIGDTDENGVVDVMDAAAIIRMASGRQTPTPAGDITGTGVVDAMSAANIARYIVGSYIPTK